MENLELPLSLWFIFSLASLFACFFVYMQVKFHVRNFPPGPLFLSLLFMRYWLSQELHKMISLFRKKYGPLFSFPWSFHNTVIAADYDTAKDLLSHPAALARPESLMQLFPGVNGFTLSNGGVWQEQRRFCITTLRTLGYGKGPWETIIQEEAAEFVEYVQKTKGKPMDASGALNRSLVSSMMALLTGLRLSKEETNPDMEIIRRINEMIRTQHQTANPVLHVPWLLKYFVKFNIFGHAENMKLMEDYNDIFRREILKYQNSSDKSDSTGLIGPYFEALEKKRATGESSNYSVENLVGNLIHLFIGGTDTIFLSLQWLILLMAAYPHVQKKVQEEIDDTIGRSERAFWDDRQRLPYTLATILEMERWAAVFPFYIPRRASETFEFRGYIIPKYTVIIGANWAIHRDPKYWNNPDEYVPERFLENSGNNGKVPWRCNGYAPFSFGKRNCPGETVGLMTVFIYFTHLMQKFTIMMPPGRQVDLSPERYDVIVEPKMQEFCFTER